MQQIGILFDIDELGGGFYGYAAYRILFASIEKRCLHGCILKDGDTNATLTEGAREYCIVVESAEESTINSIKRSIGGLDTKGLFPASSRFLSDLEVFHEPLVFAGRITSDGDLVDCNTPWIIQAWNEST